MSGNLKAFSRREVVARDVRVINSESKSHAWNSRHGLEGGLGAKGYEQSQKTY